MAEFYHSLTIGAAMSSRDEWRLAYTEVQIQIRRYKSYLPAFHLRGGLRQWDRRALQIFNLGMSLEGAKPLRVIEETLDQLHYEMFGNVVTA